MSTTEADDLIQRLRAQADEIAKAGHSGWGNASAFAADEIERLRAERDALKARIEGAPVGELHVSLAGGTLRTLEGNAWSIAGKRVALVVVDWDEAIDVAMRAKA